MGFADWVTDAPWCNAYRATKALGCSMEELYSLIEDRSIRIDEQFSMPEKARKCDMLRIDTASIGKFIHRLLMEWRQRKEKPKSSREERQLEKLTKKVDTLLSAQIDSSQEVIPDPEKEPVLVPVNKDTEKPKARSTLAFEFADEDGEETRNRIKNWLHKDLF